jgi:hypothetical protein
VPGKEYPIQVPQVDADGNDMGGVRYPDMQVPLGTYLGWALRKGGFGEGELLSTNGCIITFARTKAERDANGDPRLSIEERCGEPCGLCRSGEPRWMAWSKKD